MTMIKDGDVEGGGFFNGFLVVLFLLGSESRTIVPPKAV